MGKKEGKRKGKNGIGPRMKNGRANHKQNRAFKNGGYSVTCHLILFSCNRPLLQFCVSLVVPYLLLWSCLLSVLYLTKGVVKLLNLTVWFLIYSAVWLNIWPSSFYLFGRLDSAVCTSSSICTNSMGTTHKTYSVMGT